MSRRKKRDIVNVRMVITEEKIVSNIEKIQKLINPKSKKQIVKLEEDTYFKDMIEAIKIYLVDYPNKRSFPLDVYKATFSLVEYSISQFEDNTKKIEELIIQRERNISLAENLKKLLQLADEKVDWFEDEISESVENYEADVIDSIRAIYESDEKDSEEYQAADKLVKARIGNLEGNLHIEIDMERVTDRSKALSYIGIEIAEALKTIPAPVSIGVEDKTEVKVHETKAKEATAKVDIAPEAIQVVEEYQDETTFEVKPTLWQKIKNSKIVRSIQYITRIKVKLDYSALPEGRGE